MMEAPRILQQATSRSFVVLDEIGRGTSTYDGLSIAWAVVEHLHRAPERGPGTLFATPYQELTQLETPPPARPTPPPPKNPPPNRPTGSWTCCNHRFLCTRGPPRRSRNQMNRGF